MCTSSEFGGITIRKLFTVDTGDVGFAVFPQEQLVKLGGFNRQRKGKVFRIVELRPVALVTKGNKLPVEGIDVGWVGHLAVEIGSTLIQD